MKNTDEAVTDSGKAPSVIEHNAQMKLICMSFDGDYVTEGSFQSVNDAWNHANDMGSRWFFYPFYFVTTASGKTIKDAPEPLDWLIGRRVKNVRSIFADYSKREDAKNMDAESFAFFVGSEPEPVSLAAI